MIEYVNKTNMHLPRQKMWGIENMWDPISDSDDM
jgi:hypothetical protein